GRVQEEAVGRHDALERVAPGERGVVRALGEGRVGRQGRVAERRQCRRVELHLARRRGRALREGQIRSGQVEADRALLPEPLERDAGEARVAGGEERADQLLLGLLEVRVAQAQGAGQPTEYLPV